MEYLVIIKNIFKKKRHPSISSNFFLPVLLLLVGPTWSFQPPSADHVTLTVAENGLREIRLSYQGILLLETSLVYQTPFHDGVSLTRASDGETLVESASRHGLVEDCAVKTSKGDLKRFREDFFDVHHGISVVAEADVMAVYMGEKSVSEVIAFPKKNIFAHTMFNVNKKLPNTSSNSNKADHSRKYPMSIRSKIRKATADLTGKTHTKSRHSVANNTKVSKSKTMPVKLYYPFTLHATIVDGNDNKNGFYNLFEQYLDISRESEKCREFYRQAREKLMLLYSLINEKKQGDKVKEVELGEKPDSQKIRPENEKKTNLRKEFTTNRETARQITTSQNIHTHHTLHREYSKQGIHQHQQNYRHQSRPKHRRQTASKNPHHENKRHRFRQRKNVLHRLQLLQPSNHASLQKGGVQNSAFKGAWDIIDYTSIATKSTSSSTSWVVPTASSERIHLSSTQANSRRRSNPSSSAQSSKVQSNTALKSQPRIEQFPTVNRTHVQSQLRLPNSQVTSRHSKYHTDFYDLIRGSQIRAGDISPQWIQYSPDAIFRTHNRRLEKHNKEGTLLARHKRDLLSGYFIVPGTKWCGDGDIADHYDDLGTHEDVDKCCRRHDHCPLIISRLSTKFGMFNYRLHTISHCHCDRKMRHCLERSRSPMAEMTGQLYFNIVGPACFKLQETTSCVTSMWWGGCREYATTKVAYTKSQRRFKTRAHRRREIRRKLRKGKIREAKRLRKTMRKRKMRKKKMRRRKNRRKKNITGAAALSYTSLNEIEDIESSDSKKVLELFQDSPEANNRSKEIETIESPKLFDVGGGDGNTSILLGFTAEEQENSTLLYNQTFPIDNETDIRSNDVNTSLLLDNSTMEHKHSTLVEKQDFSIRNETDSKDSLESESLADGVTYTIQNKEKKVGHMSQQSTKSPDQRIRTTEAPKQEESWWYFF